MTNEALISALSQLISEGRNPHGYNGTYCHASDRMRRIDC